MGTHFIKIMFKSQVALAFHYSHLKLLQYLEATQFFAWNCAPFLVALASFTTYVLVDPVNNILDSQTAFVSLSLFNTMRGPLFMLPFGIASLIQGTVSIKRISEFLAQAELDPDTVNCQYKRYNKTLFIWIFYYFSG